MRKDNVKNSKALNQEQSDRVADLLHEFFNIISYEDVDETLTSMFQMLLTEHEELSPTIKALNEMHFTVRKLSTLVKKLEVINEERLSNELLKPIFSDQSTKLEAKKIFPDRLIFTQDSDSMNDNSQYSVKLGEKIECEKIEIDKLEAGYNCVFILNTGIQKLAYLTNIDHVFQNAILTELNPLNRTVYDLSEFKAAYIVVNKID